MNDLRAVIIAGSQHLDSQTAKVAAAVESRLNESSRFAAASLVDLAREPLPLLGAADGDADRVAALDATLSDCDALVIMTPEWHGMATAAIKNFFLHYSRGQLAHKPALLISVSAGAGGAYPIAELRSSSYKNSRICYLPEHLIVRNVNGVFNSSGDNNAESQAYLAARLDYCLAMLATYAEHMRAVRKQLPDGSAYTNGM
ncbi:MAG: NAD(P)H-dependent oxidoreductase [Pseudomonadota bacterium]